MKISLWGVLIELADATMSYPRRPFRSGNGCRGRGRRGYSGGFPNDDIFYSNLRGGRGGDSGFLQGERGGYAQKGRGGRFSPEPNKWFRPRAPRNTDDHRHWEYAASLPPPHCERFIVVSYNILADYLVRDHRPKLYDHIPLHILDWERRKRNIIFELGLWNPDIMCLQEVDKFQELLDELKFKGYNGTWKMRTGLPMDGCATFWRSDKFELVHEENIEFKQLGLRDNVAQICVLELSKGQAEMDLETSSSSSCSLKKPKQLVVCNVHIHYNPNRGEVKLGQVRVLLNQAHAVSRLWNDAPVVVCGDFNCTPKSPLYNFISHQKLELSGLARNQISGQFSANLGPPASGYGHNMNSQGYGWGNGAYKPQEHSYNKSSSPVGSFLGDEGNHPISSSVELTNLGGENVPLNHAEDLRTFCQSSEDISLSDTDKKQHLLSDEVIKLQGTDLNEESISKGTKMHEGVVHFASEFTQDSVNMQMRNLVLERTQWPVFATKMEIQTVDCNRDATFEDGKPSHSNMSVQLTSETSSNLLEKILDKDDLVSGKNRSAVVSENIHVEHDTVHVNSGSNIGLQSSKEATSRESPCSGHSTTFLKNSDQQVQQGRSDFSCDSVAYALGSNAFGGLVSYLDTTIAKDVSEETVLPIQVMNDRQELPLEGSSYSNGNITPSILLDVVSKDIESNAVADSMIPTQVKPDQPKVPSQEEPSVPTVPRNDEAKELFYDPCTWHPDEIAAASGLAGCIRVEHPMQLRSVYTEVEDFAGTKDSSREPLVTSYNRKFMGTVDYIWCSKGLQTIKVLDTLPKHVLQRTRGFPTHKWGSDHLAIACYVILKGDTFLVAIRIHPPQKAYCEQVRGQRVQ